jgi:hypothetical protein
VTDFPASTVGERDFERDRGRLVRRPIRRSFSEGGSLGEGGDDADEREVQGDRRAGVWEAEKVRESDKGL